MENNTVPAIEVGDIEKMYKFITEQNLEIVMPVDLIDKYMIFQCKDTEGNVIEFYQILK